jgi:hypothetical protein
MTRSSTRRCWPARRSSSGASSPGPTATRRSSTRSPTTSEPRTGGRSSGRRRLARCSRRSAACARRRRISRSRSPCITRTTPRASPTCRPRGACALVGAQSGVLTPSPSCLQQTELGHPARQAILAPAQPSTARPDARVRLLGLPGQVAREWAGPQRHTAAPSALTMALSTSPPSTRAAASSRSSSSRRRSTTRSRSSSHRTRPAPSMSRSCSPRQATPRRASISRR